MSKIDGNIIKKTLIYFVGNFSSKIIMAIMIPFYAYFVTVEELGLFDYSQTLMNIIAPVVFLALWEAILRFVIVEKNQEKRNNILFTSTVVVLIIIIILLLTSVLFGFFLQNELLLYTTIMICAYGTAQVWQYYSRALSENKVYIQASVTGSIVNFFTLIIFILFFDLGVNALFWSYILGQLSIIIMIESKINIIAMLKGNQFDWPIFRLMLIFSLPLVLNLASSWIIAGSGRIVIMQNLGAFESGIYSFAMKFGTIVSMFGSVIAMALIEEAIIKSEEEEIDAYFSNIIEIVFKLFLTICIIATPFIYFFYILLPDNGYVESYSLVYIFLIYSVFITMSTNVGAIFQARSKTRSLFYTTILSAIVTVILSILLVNVAGIEGVVIAQVLGALTLLISRWLLAKRLITLSVSWKEIIILLTIYIYLAVTFNMKISVIGVILSGVLLFYSIYLNKDAYLQFKNLKRKSN